MKNKDGAISTQKVIDAINEKLCKMTGSPVVAKAYVILNDIENGASVPEKMKELAEDVAPLMKRGTAARAQLIGELTTLAKLLYDDKTVKGDDKDSNDTPQNGEPIKSKTTGGAPQTDDVMGKLIDCELIKANEELLDNYDESLSDFVQDGDELYVDKEKNVVAIVLSEEQAEMVEGFGKGDVFHFDEPFVYTAEVVISETEEE